MPDPYVHVPPGTFEALAGGADAQLASEDAHHLRRVLRLVPGASLLVSDGIGGEAPAVLTADGVRLTGEPTRHPEPTPRIHVVQAMAKSRKVDDVVRAVTELGASAVTVVAAERSVVRLTGDKAGKVEERWRSIARSAAGQSRRAHLPDVAGPCTIAQLLDELPDGTVGLVPHVGAQAGLRTALLARSEDVHEVVVAIGPEGGWTGSEIERFGARGFEAVSLGRSVLRTEHAGLVAAGAVAALLGWMD